MTTILRPSTDPKNARVLLALILGAAGAIPLVFLNPPFQAPDEVQHFYRAYELSEFRIRAEVRNGVAGGTLPASLPLLVKSSVYTPDGMFYPAIAAPMTKTLKLAAIPLDSSKREFVAFPGSAFYSPLPYLPQVLGIAIGRVIGLGPLYLFYLGRLFNCLAALALVVLAVKSIPFAEELVILVGLLPMSLFLYASLSADAAVIACSLLFTALSFAASERGYWKTWELVMAAAVASVFCSVKPVYAPILLAGIIPGLFQSGKAAKIIRTHAILLVVALGSTAGWLLFTKSSMTSPLDGAHPSVQISLVLHHPMLLLRAIAHSLGFVDSLVLYFQAAGDFGWLTIPLSPGFFLFLPITSLFIVWALGRPNFAGRAILPALWHLSLALSSAFLIMTAMYLMYATVGQDSVAGVQGRYFIPLLALVGLALTEFAPGSLRSTPRWRSLACVAVFIVAEIVATDTTIVRDFQVFS